MNGSNGAPLGTLNFGSDGIALSADAQILYFSPVASRHLYSVPTALLRDRSPTSALKVSAAVQNHGDKGISDGLETDSNGVIYGGNMEDNSIVRFDPKMGLFETWVRDPRFSWTDTLFVASDGYLYFTENQLWLSPSYQGGVNKRVKPWVVFRVPLPGNASKVSQGGARRR